MGYVVILTIHSYYCLFINFSLSNLFVAKSSTMYVDIITSYLFVKGFFWKTFQFKHGSAVVVVCSRKLKPLQSNISFYVLFLFLSHTYIMVILIIFSYI